MSSATPISSSFVATAFFSIHSHLHHYHHQPVSFRLFAADFISSLIPPFHHHKLLATSPSSSSLLYRPSQPQPRHLSFSSLFLPSAFLIHPQYPKVAGCFSHLVHRPSSGPNILSQMKDKGHGKAKQKGKVNSMKQSGSVPKKIWAEASLNAMKVQQLKQILAQGGMQVQGKKTELVQRIMEQQQLLSHQKQKQVDEMDGTHQKQKQKSKRKNQDTDESNIVMNGKKIKQEQQKKLIQRQASNPEPLPVQSDAESPSQSTTAPAPSPAISSSATRESIPRSVTPRKSYVSSAFASPASPGLHLLRVLSWNVAGIRAVLNKDESKRVIEKWIQKHQPDVLMLQEHKLQEQHVEEVNGIVKEICPGYQAFWACSTAKKGYSGVVTLVRSHLISDKGALKVQYGIGDPVADLEGRVITIELPQIILVNVYVPNSGEKLARLDYRTTDWDQRLAVYLAHLEKDRNKPVVLGGDLNVAYADADFFNPQEARMKKQAGTTPQERQSYRTWTESIGMIDSFRCFHPKATGVYTYWSMRARNRPYNRGLRLDYFIVPKAIAPSPALTTEKVLVEASQDMKPQDLFIQYKSAKYHKVAMVDSFVLDEDLELKSCSDHAPIGIDFFIEMD